jgi:hypothetical protein
MVSLLPMVNLYSILVSVLFITTVTIFPSLFLKEVLSMALLLVVVLTRKAPSFINFEK